MGRRKWAGGGGKEGEYRAASVERSGAWLGLGIPTPAQAGGTEGQGGRGQQRSGHDCHIGG